MWRIICILRWNRRSIVLNNIFDDVRSGFFIGIWRMEYSEKPRDKNYKRRSIDQYFMHRLNYNSKPDESSFYMNRINPKLTREKSEPKVPMDLRNALASAPKVMTVWKSLTPIARRDFISWIEGAKRAETRTRRIKVACSKLMAGKRRPCCYAIVPMNLYKALSANPKSKAKWRDLTPTERRDFIGWIDSASQPETRTGRIEKVCAILASGKQHPY